MEQTAWHRTGASRADKFIRPGRESLVQPPPQALRFSHGRGERETSDWWWTARDHGKGIDGSFPPSFARTFSSKERRLGTRQPLSSDRTTEKQPPPQALRFSQGRGERETSDWWWTARDHGKGTDVSPVVSFPPSFARTSRETSGYEADREGFD